MREAEKELSEELGGRVEGVVRIMYGHGVCKHMVFGCC